MRLGQRVLVLMRPETVTITLIFPTDCLSFIDYIHKSVIYIHLKLVQISVIFLSVKGQLELQLL